MLSKIRVWVAMGICLALGWLARTWYASDWTGGRIQSFHSGPTIEQVQALSCLVTQRVDVADAQETRLEGHTGGMKAALLIKGDFLLGTDLSRARFESVDAAARKAILVLPQPRVTSPRLDHDRTRIFAITQTGLWQLTPDDGGTAAAVLNHAYRDAQEFVGQACRDPTLAGRARRQAEQVLRTFFQAVGWDVAIRWSD